MERRRSEVHDTETEMCRSGIFFKPIKQNKFEIFSHQNPQQCSSPNPLLHLPERGMLSGKKSEFMNWAVNGSVPK